MTSKDKELLFELYLSSLEGSSDYEFQLFLPTEELPADTNFSFEPSKCCQTSIIGSVVVIETNEHDICCLITEESENNTFKAYKISEFTGFASEYDVRIKLGSSDYILETDNHFHVQEDEVSAGIILNTVSPAHLANIKEAIQITGKTLNRHNTDLSSPDNKFRIIEHKLTLPLRSRQPLAVLWIPQVDLQYRRDPDSGPYMAAADCGLDQAFSFLHAQQDENVFYAREFSLHKNECHDLLLIPDAEFISRKAEVRCGAVIVFRGVLPESITLARFMPLPVFKAQQFLQISIKLLQD
ncbi:MAG: hypothetical protein LHW54_05990 [Candidatus Cloacimonetes bacterium]|jgi:hypothetical protein|nr:hypothetical protein [Candidatus Cloacimonadota bacterium]